ncbi:MAG: bile acid:sodium symporter [Planctomycetota bacterium]
MATADLIKILVPLTLIEMMFAIGLGVNVADLITFAKNVRMATKAAIANYLVVPSVAVGLLLAISPTDPTVAAGFLILAVCPGAPFGPSCTMLARGNVATAVGLMVLLAGTSAFAAPLLLHFLLPVVSRSQPLTVDAGQILRTLLVTQLVPLCLGLALRRWRPKLADRWLRPANVLNLVLNVSTLGVVLLAYYPLLANIRVRGYAGMVALLVASWIAGWLLGGPKPDDRRSLLLTTALRNVGVGMVLATVSFGGTAAVTAVVVYGMVEIFGTLILALVLGRMPLSHPDR